MRSQSFPLRLPRLSTQQRLPQCSPQRVEHQPYRLSHRLPHRFGAWFVVLSGVMLFTTTVESQTLFARPDTTPNYASYRHLEECITTVFRITDATAGKEQTIWWDTISAARGKVLRTAGIQDNELRSKTGTRQPRPDAAIQAGRTCLARFNADTATFKSVGYAQVIMGALLMAHRDDDARRFAERFLDSMRLQSATIYKDNLHRVLEWYVEARPIRYAEAKRYHAKILETVAGDSLYRTIRADRRLSIAAEEMGDTTYANELAWHAIRINDAMPVEERKRSPDAMVTLGWLALKVWELTQDEGLDSLTISTLAYNLWYANSVVRRVRGGEPITATDARVQPYKVPDLVGEHYYTSTTGASSGPSSQTYASYIKQGAVSPGTLPVKGRINYITSWASFCHTESPLRPPEAEPKWTINGGTCAKRYNVVRKMKELYPDIEIIVLSNTYGHVGQLSPLEFADEADTLAKLFLGRHRVPAHLVVEHTPFFHVDAPDGRRIDLLTPQMELLGKTREMYDQKGGIKWLVDKDGYVVGMGPSEDGDSWFDRVYTILKNRPSKK